MGPHRCGRSAGEDVAELAHELVLAERATVRFQDALLDLHAALLAEEGAELAGVVLLDEDEPLRLLERGLDVSDGEWLHRPDLPVAHLLALPANQPYRILDSGLARAHAPDRGI